MPQATLPGYRVDVQGLLLGHECHNIFHVEGSNPSIGSLAEAADIADVFENWLGTDVAPLLSDQFAFTELHLKLLQGTPFAVYDRTLSPTIPGTVAQQSIGNNRALVLSWRTGYSGRSFRGRSFMAGLPETALTNANDIDTTTASTWLAAATSLINDLITNSTPLVIASFVQSGTPLNPGQTTPVLNAVVNTRIDTQRRRMKNAS